MSKRFFDGKSKFGDSITLCRYAGNPEIDYYGTSLELAIWKAHHLPVHINLTRGEAKQLKEQLERFLNDAVADGCEEMKFDHEV